MKYIRVCLLDKTQSQTIMFVFVESAVTSTFILSGWLSGLAIRKMVLTASLYCTHALG